jgi:hypothetical protein
MLTRSVVLATTLTVGLVAGVGSSALAVAFVPGDSSGVTELVQAIAAPAQDPAEGSNASFIDGTPVKVHLPRLIVIHDQGDEPAADADPATDPAPEPTGHEGRPTSGNSGDDNSGNDNSGQSAEDKAKEDKAKEDKAKEDKAKEDKKDESEDDESDA